MSVLLHNKKNIRFIDTNGIVGETIFTENEILMIDTAFGLQEENNVYSMPYFSEDGNIIPSKKVQLKLPFLSEQEDGTMLNIIRDVHLLADNTYLSLVLHDTKVADTEKGETTHSSKLQFVSFDQDGEVLKIMTADTDAIQADIESFDRFLVDHRGYFCVMTGQKASESVLFTENGEYIESIPYNFNQITLTESGYLIASANDTLCFPDDSYPYADTIKCEEVSNLYPVSDGCEYEFVYSVRGTKTNTIYGYDLKKNRSKRLFNETKLDFSLSDKDYCIFKDSAFYQLVQMTDFSYLNVMSRQKDKNNEKKKETIYLAKVGVNTDFVDNAYEFNLKNKDYRLEIIDYSNYENPVEELGKDIAKGRQIDLYDLTGYDYTFLSDKGLLADIDELIRADDELSSIEFNREVRDCLLQGDTLYEIVPYYYICTVLADTAQTDVFGEWNKNTLWQLEERNRVNTSCYEVFFFDYINERDCWYNPQEKWCDFESDSFKECLKRAADYPNLAHLDGNSESNMKNLHNKGYLEYYLTMQELCVIDYYNQNAEKPIAIAGYPFNESTGNLLYPILSLGVASNTTAPEAAWQYAKMFLAEEYQFYNGVIHGFFCNRNDIMEELYHYYTYHDTFYPSKYGNLKVYESNYVFSEEAETVISSGNPESIGELMQALFPLCGIRQNCPQVEQIIGEETSALFAGQKDVDQVAETIQNRVSIYMNE